MTLYNLTTIFLNHWSYNSNSSSSLVGTCCYSSLCRQYQLSQSLPTPSSLGISIRKVAKRHDRDHAWVPSKLKFTHGAASGDPYDTSVIPWTGAVPSMDYTESNFTVSGYVPLYNHDNNEHIKVEGAGVR